MRADDLIHGVKWWELGGHNPAALADMWHIVHHAAQVPAEVGKGWAVPRDDDSHSSLVWLPSETLQNQLFAGEIIEGVPAVRAVFRPWDLRLFVVDGSGEQLGEFDLVGHTAAEGLGWIREIVGRRVGEPRQKARPAPDLPEHPVGDAVPFEEPSQLAVAEVLRLYGNADAVLTRLAESVDGADAPRTWPHHFDLATLVTAERNDSGEATRTVGIGLAPPDSLSKEGYWYVSPWSNDGSPARTDAAWPDLPSGAWHQRENAMPMAMLPIGETSSTEDPKQQHERTASFIAAAYEACMRAHDHG